MSNRKLFPSGIAKGNAFCNRETERNYLKQCIDNNEHVVLVSPRRYGKTSLIAKVIEDCHIDHVSIDLLLAPDSNYVRDAILSGVAQLCSNLIEKSGSVKDKIFSIFDAFNPKLTLSAFGQKLELSANTNSVQTIAEALLSLEDAAQIANKKIVFVMDEFQQVATLNNHHNVEASIRHAVERSKNITYIFSGSNRHLLEQMFNDKARPLYHLCELMRLNRISAQAFVKFIAKIAQKKWGASIDDRVFLKIMELTHCHTFYVNRICRLLWKNETIPSIKDIDAIWNNYVYEQQWVIDDLTKLTANQRKIMTALAVQPSSEIYGEYIRSSTGINPSSIAKTICSLEKSDLIYKDKSGVYFVLDPAIAYFITTKKPLNVQGHLY